MVPPSLPENFDELSGAERTREEYLYRCRLVHYHYVTSTEECNELHYATFRPLVRAPLPSLPTS